MDWQDLERAGFGRARFGEGGMSAVGRAEFGRPEFGEEGMRAEFGMAGFGERAGFGAVEFRESRVWDGRVGVEQNLERAEFDEDWMRTVSR